MQARGRVPGPRRTGGGQPRRVQVDQPGSLDVVGLGEGVGDGRAAVADGLAERRASVQVSEGGVVEAVEQGQKFVLYFQCLVATYILKHNLCGIKGNRKL